ncbi:ketoacyl-ACP synthase III family protein [Solwaraspora sp. WMMB335]|uniref:ketoacyl-ACP synthase III family protein n=1 Tax=Solwaraspora sp. WMMB335 TaxID=3404118 RepID=UPI003B949C39
MKVKDLYLAGIGGYLPGSVSTALAVEKGWYDEQRRLASKMESVAVEETVPAPDMAVRAANTALHRSGHTPEEIGTLLHSNTYHQGPDGWSAPHYVLRNTIDRPVQAMEIRQGCLGMLAGLEVGACRLIAGAPEPAVLLTTGDNFSTPLVDRWNASGLFLFADAGAAVVLSRRPGFARLLAIGSLSEPSMEALHRGDEPLLPPSVTLGRALDFDSRLRYWRSQWAAGVKPPIADFGARVADIADRTLDEAGIGMSQVRRVCHIGFNWDPLHAMFLEPLGIDADRGVWDFSRTVGHTGVADLVLGLDYLWSGGHVVPGDHVLLIGAATGMEAGCAVLQITESPDA